MATIRIDWPGAPAIVTDRFRVRAARPLLDRPIGKLVGGAAVVARYADPVWTMDIELGPIPRAETARIRSHVGVEGTLTIDVRNERPTRDYPAAEIWINASSTATLVKAVPHALGDDIAQGDVWALQLQFAESSIEPL